MKTNRSLFLVRSCANTAPRQRLASVGAAFSDHIIQKTMQ